MGVPRSGEVSGDAIQQKEPSPGRKSANHFMLAPSSLTMVSPSRRVLPDVLLFLVPAVVAGVLVAAVADVPGPGMQAAGHTGNEMVAHWPVGTAENAFLNVLDADRDTDLFLSGAYRTIGRSGEPAVVLENASASGATPSVSAGTFLLRFWFRADDAAGTIIALQGDDRLRVRSDGSSGWLMVEGAAGPIVSTPRRPRWQADDWYRATVAVEDGVVTLLVGGDVVGRGNWSGDGRFSRIVVGDGFEGGIDDIRLYSGAPYHVLVDEEPLDGAASVTTGNVSRPDSLARLYTEAPRSAARYERFFGVPVEGGWRYGPFVVDGARYYAVRTGDGAHQVVDTDGGRMDDARIETRVWGMKELYDATVLDPLFYAPELTGFDARRYDDYEQKLVTERVYHVNRSQQEYIASSIVKEDALLAHRYLRNLSATARQTALFLNRPSWRNAEHLLSRYDAAVNAYRADFSSLLRIFLRAHPTEAGRVVPVQYRFELGRRTTNTTVLADDFQHVLANAGAIRDEIEERRLMLRDGFEPVSPPDTLQRPVQSAQSLTRHPAVIPESDWETLAWYRWTPRGFRAQNNTSIYMAGVWFDPDNLSALTHTRSYTLPVACTNKTYRVIQMPDRTSGRLFVVDAVPWWVQHIPFSPAVTNTATTRLNGSTLLVEAYNRTYPVPLTGPVRGPADALGTFMRVGDTVGVMRDKTRAGPVTGRCLYIQNTLMDFFVLDHVYQQVNETPVFSRLLDNPETARQLYGSLYPELRRGLNLETEFLAHPSLATFRKLEAAYGRIYYRAAQRARRSGVSLTYRDMRALHDARDHYLSMRTRLSALPKVIDHFYDERRKRIRWWSFNYRNESGKSIQELVNPVTVLQNGMYPAVFTSDTPAVWRLDESPQRYASGTVLPRQTYVRP